MPILQYEYNVYRIPTVLEMAHDTEYSFQSGWRRKYRATVTVNYRRLTLFQISSQKRSENHAITTVLAPHQF